MVHQYRLKQVDMIDKDKPITQCEPIDLVYIIPFQTSLLKASSRKFRIIYIGLLVVYKIIDVYLYILVDIEGKTVNGIFPFNIAELAFLRKTKHPVSTLVDLTKYI